LKIRRLKLSGFKSFVEPAELRIEAGLTGIVGPNGCGKSNLLEAIRWTMGESSPKSLRGGGMDDVIFAGTSLNPSRDLALDRRPALDRSAIEQDRDLGEVAGRPAQRPGEDDVVHAPAAQRFGAGFAHHPADRFEEVRLAAAVGADHAGQAGLDPELRRLDEALEAAELEPPDLQGRSFGCRGRYFALASAD
jgi:chromosome segregation protein